ncbi:hypothetical protein AURDEDRAFT_126919 [Auricularia subglabra TFB-10046 SS5]|nr:hypothetical protein AURDEDRAFT_126919 [Auricularia subglabra TFB-10046 SS5]
MKIHVVGRSYSVVEPGFELEWPDLNEDRGGPIDALIVTTKAQHVGPSLAKLKSRLSRASTLFILCNGLPSVLPLVTQEVFSPDDCPSLILGHTSHGVHRVITSDAVHACHGTWNHAGAGRIVCSVWPETIARTFDGDPPSLKVLKSALQACESLSATFVSYRDWLDGALAKLGVNCAANAASALIGDKNGALLAPAMRDFLDAVLREVAAVFAVRLADEAPSVQPGASPSTHPLSHQMLLRTTLDVLAVTQDNTSSTLSDVLRLSHRDAPEAASSGPFTELEHLNGYISKLGRQYNMPTPLNDALVALVEAKCRAIASTS